MHQEAAHLIEALGLKSHPEGGYFRVSWQVLFDGLYRQTDKETEGGGE